MDSKENFQLKLLEDMKKIPLKIRLYTHVKFDLLDLEHDVKTMFVECDREADFEEYMKEFRVKCLKGILKHIKEWEEDGKP